MRHPAALSSGLPGCAEPGRSPRASVVAVPLPGCLVERTDGCTAQFSGDPASMNRPLDADVEKLGESVGLRHANSKARADVLPLPAHDAVALERFPARTSRR
jgi:hypothetical protein